MVFSLSTVNDQFYFIHFVNLDLGFPGFLYVGACLYRLGTRRKN